ncbi:metal ABC transporter permease [Veillonella sp.]
MTILQSYTTQMVLLGTALLGLASGIAGTFAVLRKESLIGDGLSHAALPGVVIAFLLTGIKDIEVLIIGAALSSITAAWLITITVENSKIKFDGALATILSAFFGLGMVLLTYLQSLNNAGQAGLSKFIFGQAATILARDVYITSAAALIIIVLTALFWKELKLISFDVEYAKTLQIPVTFTLILYRSLLIMTIIIGIQSVGAILISSLLIAPAVGARQWTNKLGTMCILAGFFGMISAIGGTIWSTTVQKLPTGPAIIVILSVIVLLSLIFAPNRGILWQYRKNKQSKRALLSETARISPADLQQKIYRAESGQPRIGGAP